MPVPLHELRLAFAYRQVVELIRADTEVDGTELAFLERAFPSEELRALGLLDAEGVPTARFEAAVEEARRELPQRLTLGEKLALVDLVAEASAADGILVPEEADALAAVARALGVGDAQWLAHLEGLIDGGQLRRGY